ncbi:hypothetical protein ThvES_00016620 [Thiovulum sp. ES]|nr:hypothetical protein ThvES_00016620 [Thiovulum sp. ES]
MKILNLSLATVVALGSFAYAEEVAPLEKEKSAFLRNLDITGQATLYYQTMVNNPYAPWYALGGTSDKQIDDETGLFHKESSRANVGFSLKMTSDLGNGFGFGARFNVLETLGLEHNLVSGTMQGVAGSADNDHVVLRTGILDLGTAKHTPEADENPAFQLGQSDEEYFFGEAYLTKTMGKSTFVLGRQTLDTPFLYSESWNVFQNTFDAIVLVDQNLADQGVTLIGAYVGKHNNHTTLGQFNTLAGGLAADGAYAIAGVYGQDNVSGQAWFYNIPTVANAYWVDAMYKMDNIHVAGQVAGFMFDDDISDADDTTAFAGMACYKMGEGAKISVAGSVTSGKADSHEISNLGTDSTTKLFTATPLLNGNGHVAGATETTALKVAFNQTMGASSLGLRGAMYMHGEDSSAVSKINSSFATADVKDITGMVLEAEFKTKLVGVDLSAGYVLTQNVYGWNVWKENESDSELAHTLRVVGRYNF